MPKDANLQLHILATSPFSASRDAIDIFRHGGFATIDEFSKLAGGRFPKKIQELKKLLRLVLSIRNPEDNFTASDYYAFVQKLFRQDLSSLRDDVAVLTFNYDPYLPYLVDKAYNVRCKAAGIEAEHHVLDAITSGFSSRQIGALEDGRGLCVLQLHGSTAWPCIFDGEPVVSHKDLFETTATDRIDKLSGPGIADTMPPILFPWEVIESGGQVVAEKGFCLHERMDERGYRQGGYRGDCTLHQLFLSIWKRAKKEVIAATKVSFVGLSMHDFLNPAFRFLFADKRDNATVVVANKDHEQFRTDDEVIKNPRSPTFKVRQLLNQICPSIRGWQPIGKNDEVAGGARVKVWETFKEFIRYEMD